VDKPSFRLSQRARRDITHILAFTTRRWDEIQADRYEASLYEAFATIRRFPQSGRVQPALFPGCRTLPVEEHIVYYRESPDLIEIVRILHQRQDPTGQFDDVE
jgi:toxin ParE1/3/4